MYNYNVTDVKVIDELNEGMHEENITSYSDNTERLDRDDPFTHLINYENYRFNCFNDRFDRIEAMITEILYTQKGI